ncbi:MAG: hypothetical protein QNJ29_11170 [Rhizobiaceae bacterium]|nr:hypothetical protein [Rhizobiaceae bacterium]
MHLLKEEVDINYQYAEPIGQYYLPEQPRFKFDMEEKILISLDPNIEILDQDYHGKPGEHFRVVVLRICSKNFGYLADFDAFRDKKGYPAIDETGEMRKLDGVCWSNVRSKKTWWKDGVQQEITKFQFETIDGEIESTVMEALAVDPLFTSYKYGRRIIFKKDQPIEPKNWEVIRDE